MRPRNRSPYVLTEHPRLAARRALARDRSRRNLAALAAGLAFYVVVLAPLAVLVAVLWGAL
jgi:hypothetical protein